VPQVSKSALAIAILSALLLTGCPEHEFATCTGPVVTHPEGKCSAHYYQTDYRSGGHVTQALVECTGLLSKPGGNVVAIHSVAHGIGLKWLSANTLEVAVPAGAPLRDQRTGDTYGGYPLHYVYRQLQSGEPVLQGCGLGKAGGT
jgi:hypothetical protein